MVGGKVVADRLVVYDGEALVFNGCAESVRQGSDSGASVLRDKDNGRVVETLQADRPPDSAACGRCLAAGYNAALLLDENTALAVLAADEVIG